jgi:hypothetical protein
MSETVVLRRSRSGSGRSGTQSLRLPTSWEDLPEWPYGPFEDDEQVVVVGATGSGKSTLIATVTLDVDDLVALDAKGSLTLPRARIEELPPYGSPEWDRVLRDALRWRGGERETNRVIIRVHPNDLEDPVAHDAIFRAIYETRPGTIVWIDEITAVGASPHKVPRWLRALSARGRTRDIGLWTATQAPFGLLPVILRRNAQVILMGVVEPQDVDDIRRPGAELAATIPPFSGRWIAWYAGDPQPYRLYIPIPRELQRWSPP